MKVEMNEFLMNPDGGTPVDVAPARHGTDYRGVAVDPDNELCVARELVNPETGVGVCVVRVCTGGHNINAMFNPLEHDHAQLRQANPTHGRPWYEFRRVTEEAYRAYLQFLKTSNPVFLRDAERAI